MLHIHFSPLAFVSTLFGCNIVGRSIHFKRIYSIFCHILSKLVALLFHSSTPTVHTSPTVCLGVHLCECMYKRFEQLCVCICACCLLLVFWKCMCVCICVCLCDSALTCVCACIWSCALAFVCICMYVSLSGFQHLYKSACVRMSA